MFWSLHVDKIKLVKLFSTYLMYITFSIDFFKIKINNSIGSGWSLNNFQNMQSGIRFLQIIKLNCVLLIIILCVGLFQRSMIYQLYKKVYDCVFQCNCSSFGYFQFYQTPAIFQKGNKVRKPDVSFPSTTEYKHVA